MFIIFNKNEYLNLVKVLNTLSKLDDINIDNHDYSYFSGILKIFGDDYVSLNENNEYVFNYDKYNNHVNSTNNNDNTGDYDNIYYHDYNSIDNNNITDINFNTYNNYKNYEFKTKNGTLTVQINK